MKTTLKFNFLVILPILLMGAKGCPFSKKDDAPPPAAPVEEQKGGGGGEAPSSGSTGGGSSGASSGSNHSPPPVAVEPAPAAPVCTPPSSAAHLIYSQTGSATVFYTTNRTGCWVTTTVAENSGNASLALDSLGTVHILYHDIYQGLYHARMAQGETTFSKSFVASDVIGETAIAIDTNDTIHLAYHAYASNVYAVEYRTFSNSAWSTGRFLGINVSNAFVGLRIAAHAADSPTVSYWPYLGKLIVYQKRGGSWYSSFVDGGMTLNKMMDHPGLAVKPNGQTVVSYRLPNSDDLVIARGGYTGWTRTTEITSGNAGYATSVSALDDYQIQLVHWFSDGLNAPFVQHITSSDGGLTWIKTGPSTQALALGSSPGRSTLRVDANGSSHFCVTESSKIHYATNSGHSGAWTSTELTPAGSFSSCGLVVESF